MRRNAQEVDTDTRLVFQGNCSQLRDPTITFNLVPADKFGNLFLRHMQSSRCITQADKGRDYLVLGAEGVHDDLDQHVVFGASGMNAVKTFKKDSMLEYKFRMSPANLEGAFYLEYIDHFYEALHTGSGRDCIVSESGNASASKHHLFFDNKVVLGKKGPCVNQENAFPRLAFDVIFATDEVPADAPSHKLPWGQEMRPPKKLPINKGFAKPSKTASQGSKRNQRGIAIPGSRGRPGTSRGLPKSTRSRGKPPSKTRSNNSSSRRMPSTRKMGRS